MSIWWPFLSGTPRNLANVQFFSAFKKRKRKRNKSRHLQGSIAPKLGTARCCVGRRTSIQQRYALTSDLCTWFRVERSAHRFCLFYVHLAKLTWRSCHWPRMTAFAVPANPRWRAEAWSSVFNVAIIASRKWRRNPGLQNLRTVDAVKTGYRRDHRLNLYSLNARTHPHDSTKFDIHILQENQQLSLNVYLKPIFIHSFNIFFYKTAGIIF